MDKTEKITFRVSEELKKKIAIRAMGLNMNLAEYIRYLVTKDLEEKQNVKR